MDIWELMSGQDSGRVAIGFGLGVCFGYTFSAKTIIKEARKRITALEADLERVRSEFVQALREKGG